MLLGLLVTPALAATLALRPPEGAQAVTLIAAELAGESSALCADDGRAPDAAPGDGLWTCGALRVVEGARIAAVIDGRTLLGPVEVRRTISPRDSAYLDLEAEQIVPELPAPGAAGQPRPGRPALVIEIDLGPSKQALQLEVSTPGADTESYRCGDDGSFPDAGHNDDVLTCAGTAPGADLSFRLRSSSSQREAALAWPPTAGILAARWTESGLVPSRRRLLDIDWGEGAGEEASHPLGEPPPEPPPERERPEETSREQPAAAGSAEPAAAEDRAAETRAEEAPPAPPVAENPAGGAPSGSAWGQGAPGGSGGPGPSWLALLGAFVAGGAALRIYRGPPPRRGLARVEPLVPPGPRIERRPGGPEALALAVAERAAAGPVLLVLPPGVEAPWAPGGPVLRATSRDALDIQDMLRGLMRRDPVSAPTVIVLGSDTLVNPDGLGVPPEEQVLIGAPPAVRVLLLDGGVEGA